MNKVVCFFLCFFLFTAEASEKKFPKFVDFAVKTGDDFSMSPEKGKKIKELIMIVEWAAVRLRVEGFDDNVDSIKDDLDASYIEQFEKQIKDIPITLYSAAMKEVWCQHELKHLKQINGYIKGEPGCTPPEGIFFYSTTFYKNKDDGKPFFEIEPME